MIWRMRSTGTELVFSCMRSSAVANSGGTMSGRVESIWPSLTKVGPSASRSATNWSGVPSAGTSYSLTAAGSRLMPANTPDPRYRSNRRRICVRRLMPPTTALSAGCVA